MLHLEKPLSPEEKARVYDRIRRGEASARTEIVRTHGYFFRKIAINKVHYYHLENSAIDDLIQICFETALKEVKKFDPDKGEFSTYLMKRLRPGIDDYICKSRNIPVQLFKNQAKIIKAIKSQKAQGLIPTPVSVCAEFGFSSKHVAAILEGVQQFSSPLSLSDPLSGSVGEDGKSWIDTLEVGDPPALEGVQATRTKEILESALASLPQRQARIIKAYVLDASSKRVTLNHLSGEYKVTQERVRQIKEEGIKLLREHLGEKGFTLDDLLAEGQPC